MHQITFRTDDELYAWLQKCTTSAKCPDDTEPRNFGMMTPLYQDPNNYNTWNYWLGVRSPNDFWKRIGSQDKWEIVSGRFHKYYFPSLLNFFKGLIDDKTGPSESINNCFLDLIRECLNKELELVLQRQRKLLIENLTEIIPDLVKIIEGYLMPDDTCDISTYFSVPSDGYWSALSWDDDVIIRCEFGEHTTGV